MEECCICREQKESFGEMLMIECPARHRFCMFCIFQWRKQSKTCPLCRQEDHSHAGGFFQRVEMDFRERLREVLVDFIENGLRESP